MKVIVNMDRKIVSNCGICNKKLPKYSPHHKLCHKCWLKEQLKKGNLTVLKDNSIMEE